MKFLKTQLLAAGVAAAWSAAAWTAQDVGQDLGLPPKVAATLRGIDAERIRAQVRFLADDLLEGRGTGTRGGDIAASYIATQFALDGLKPAGDNGGYLQKVQFTGVQTLPSSSVSVQPEHGNPIDLKLARTMSRAIKLKWAASTSMRPSSSWATA